MKNDREICEAATQGKWTAKNYVVTIGGKLRIKVYGKEGVKQDDAQFIARFNPSKVAAMLNEIWRWKGFFKQIRFVLGFEEEATCEQLTHAVEQLKAERDVLQNAINNFCERTKHSDPFWHKQNYIKGLFDLWQEEQGE